VDAELGELVRHRLAQALERELARAVQAGAREAREAADAGDLDEVAGALAATERSGDLSPDGVRAIVRGALRGLAGSV
jgi:hypothetical protein